MKRNAFWILILVLAGVVSARAQSTWQEALAKMPLPTGIAELNETNCVSTLLPAFQRNDAVKTLVFQPGATDEFYFFHRGCARLTNSNPTMLDAIVALTNQSLIKATFRAPFLILHTDEDPVEPVCDVQDAATAERVKSKKFAQHALYDDQDWDFMQPLLSFYLNTKVAPGLHVHETNHFFRHSFAGYDLSGWEVLQAVAMAGKTRFTVQKKKIVFQADGRFLTKPPVPENLFSR